MIHERIIARVFAAILLVGMLCVAYVLITQPTAMITYQLQENEQKESEQQNKAPIYEKLETFEQEWNKVQDELVILGEKPSENKNPNRPKGRGINYNS